MHLFVLEGGVPPPFQKEKKRQDKNSRTKSNMRRKNDLL
jgi:hypothetical protein